MKLSFASLLVVCFMVAGCGKSHTHNHEHMHTAGDSTNDALKDMVLSIHDEVMAKGQNLYTLKKKLLDTIAHTTGMAAERKAALQALIASLDSADNAMLDWMHHFDPDRDSTDQEKRREYFETEMERINKIKEQTDEVIEKAKEQTGKK